jgi:spore germination protein
MNDQAVISDNALANPGALVPGQTLVLLIDAFPHTVVRGQTLYGIARSYGVSLSRLLAANPQIAIQCHLSRTGDQHPCHIAPIRYD